MKLSDVSEIPLKDIDGDDRLTDFSMDGCPEKLTDSVKVIGIRHPISVCPSGNLYAIVSGHKRFQAAPRSGLTRIPAFIIPEIDNASRLNINLNENFGQRHYSDIEKGDILNKLKDAGISDETIIEDYMPLLELERSKKIFQDLSSAKVLSPKLKKLLHRARVPVKTFSTFYKWDDFTSAEIIFSALKPGVNKWRELLDLLDEVSARENTTPEQILSQDEIKNSLATTELNPSQQYDRIHQYLYNQRYPVLSEMKKQMARALDEMDLDDKTRLKFQETFESDELKLELKFHSEKELSRQVEKIFKALQSGSVEKLIKIFTH
ncbi:MAG: ParB N-terminal domain-containing protein [Nitrospina sp.]|jgi:ParB/RepB/Spo0J family partition protein|nr:ParB N-terminal domain-containing protein [Nitrospina sp.]MBT5632915.1 ParB N-terminal domain-containing protein [Nitrospina sp.]